MKQTNKAKQIMLLAAACVSVFVSCTKNTPDDAISFVKGQKVTLKVSNPQTKATSSLNTATGAVDFKWEAGDQILVSVGGESETFTVSKLINGGESAEFSGTMPGNGTTTFDVQFPTTTPDLSIQTYTEGEAVPHDMMLASATGCTLGSQLTLSAQNAALRLNLYGSVTVGKIVVTNIASTAFYTLNCGTGVTVGATAAAATPFLIVMPISSTSADNTFKFKVEVFDNASTPANIGTFETSAAQSFAAAQVLNMIDAKEVKNSIPDGALDGVFSVSATEKVHFSKGNLQATYSTSTSSYTWGFAANQYDCVGGDDGTSSYPTTGNNTIDSQTDGAVVDLFGWVGASSAVMTGDHSKYGISTSGTNTDYGDVDSEALKNDWGKAIDISGTWFTLSADQWAYLLGSSTPGRSALLHKAGVDVCGNVSCLVIAPDDFTGTIEDSYDTTTWPAAEASGLVCLPAAGTRWVSDVYVDAGYYWSSTSLATHSSDQYSSYCIQFFGYYVFSDDTSYRRPSGMSVRLVCPAL